MDGDADLHNEGEMNELSLPSNTISPCPYLDYTPSMRQVGTSWQQQQQQQLAANAPSSAVSSVGRIANASFAVGGSDGASAAQVGHAKVAGLGECDAGAGSSADCLDFASLTPEAWEQMSNASVAQILIKSAGISAARVSLVGDVDFKGHWGNEAHLSATIRSKVNHMDHCLIMDALSQMHESVAKIAVLMPLMSPPSPTPPPLPPPVKSHLR
jgi:hypothetical protein